MTNNTMTTTHEFKMDNHNGCECIAMLDAKRPCDKMWFTNLQIREWADMSRQTVDRRMKQLLDCGRITEDDIMVLTTESQCPNLDFVFKGANDTRERHIYNLNVLNQLAMVELGNTVLDEMSKKFSDILSEVETTGQYKGVPQTYKEALISLAENSLKLANEIEKREQAELEAQQAVAALEVETERRENAEFALSEEKDAHQQTKNDLEVEYNRAEYYRKTKAEINDKRTATIMGRLGGAQQIIKAKQRVIENQEQVISDQKSEINEKDRTIEQLTDERDTLQSDYEVLSEGLLTARQVAKRIREEYNWIARAEKESTTIDKVRHILHFIEKAKGIIPRYKKTQYKDKEGNTCYSNTEVFYPNMLDGVRAVVADAREHNDWKTIKKAYNLEFIKVAEE